MTGRKTFQVLEPKQFRLEPHHSVMIDIMAIAKKVSKSAVVREIVERAFHDFKIEEKEKAPQWGATHLAVRL